MYISLLYNNNGFPVKGCSQTYGDYCTSMDIQKYALHVHRLNEHLDLPNTFTGGHDMYTVRSRIYRNIYIG